MNGKGLKIRKIGQDEGQLVKRLVDLVTIEQVIKFFKDVNMKVKIFKSNKHNFYQ